MKRVGGAGASADGPIREAADFLRARLGDEAPAAALMLGSGLGALADELEGAARVRYADIPRFPVSTAPGHAGVLAAGILEGRRVVVMGGRFHRYEGYGAADIAFPVRVLRAIGVGTLILTNAAGGVDASFRPGDLMAITDHLYLGGPNPLIGPDDEKIGPRFPDLSSLWDRELLRLLGEAADALGLPLRRGVYAWTGGPSFETPAEIRMLRAFGADAVGMSTVPEAIAAGHCGMRVAGISCISNMAAGMLDRPITEEEVFEITKLVRERFSGLVRGLVARL